MADKCECNYDLGMGPNLKCPVHGNDTCREFGISPGSPPELKFRIKILWSWGRKFGRFHEVAEREAWNNELENLQAIVRSVAEQIATRHCYDCGHKDDPLYPHIHKVEVTPIGKAISFDADAMCCNDVFRQIYKKDGVELK